METLEHRSTPLREASEESLSARHRGFLLAVLVGGAAILWLTPLASSFWLDETATYWVAQGSLGDMIHRGLQYQSGSIPFFFLAWISRVLGGSSEIAMRMPSVIAMAVGTLFFYRLAKRLFDKEVAVLASIAFVTSGAVAFAAADARPYALAVTSLIAATFFLVRWLDEGRWSDEILYVVFAALTIYTHYLFTIALAAHVPYVLVRRRDGDVSTGRIVLAAAAVALLLLPAGPNLVHLWNRRSILSVPAPVTVSGLLRIWAPAALVVGMAGGALLATASGLVSVQPSPARKRSWVLVITWALLPPFTLFAISLFSSSELLAGRYFLSAIPAIALVAGWGMRALQPPPARQIAALLVAGLSILAFARLQHGLWFEGASLAEDWRGVAAAERAIVSDPSTPLLFQSGFIEARHIKWFSNAEKSAYLLSPLSIYPMNGHVIALPYNLTSSAERYMSQVSTRYLVASREFLLVTRLGDNSFRAWLDGDLRGLGFRSRLVRQFGALALVLFQRR